MGRMTEKPVKIIEKLEDKLGEKLKDIINIFKFGHRYRIYKKEVLIASFKIKPMPGQCGVCIIYNLYVKNTHQRQGIGSLVLSNAIEIAKEAGYTSILCTIQKINEFAIKMVLFQEFKLVNQFRNFRTKNAILVFNKNITKD
jgi:GNAT superfamily N-acetyltransferase